MYVSGVVFVEAPTKFNDQLTAPSPASLPSNTRDAPTVGTSAMILKNWIVCCGCW